MFIAVLAFFHCSEFLLACIFMRDELSIRSWLISKAYVTAMAFALLEYLLEACAVPSIKIGDGGMGTISWLGLSLVLLGEGIRKLGMITARSNFTHNIRTKRHPTHVLVTRGIYRFIRHPGYLGWFMWCLGTQMLLGNPICVIGFAVVAWRFFSSRIATEETYLRQFFGDAYDTYAARTPTWIPFIP
ncbi:hypothetical protein VOLCADRAFT_77213 [Volvox carteri f. nagariensis]|uniref:Protein-S-isoprenylcysteine O-methyltransferase n=1 Tax=Volvox carteri f. nagariensis TaxID=3068 RepID=D8UDG1_VOLCA|nr:uncharacterized protein VOLCADRAFT_77213 [Volvox carteri f. nagariensis]EFJ42306.1 hypothetical protein VOLCADRAFT_77213 [Volvox carteri f. nagariensis]|eukprot:XP_002956704.1 hypothetical protein VOLCADRAFT_77213 [Volvox carteri f. nagariensis]